MADKRCFVQFPHSGTDGTGRDLPLTLHLAANRSIGGPQSPVQGVIFCHPEVGSR